MGLARTGDTLPRQNLRINLLSEILRERAAGCLAVLEEVQEQLRLVRGLDQKGAFSAEIMEQTLRTLRDFRSVAVAAPQLHATRNGVQIRASRVSGLLFNTLLI